MTGLFFCLASAEGAGLLFCPAAMQQNTSVYSGFCPVHASYTANTAKQRTGLYRRFSCGLSHFTAADARPAQAAIYHLRHARAYHSAVAPPTRARYHSRAGTLDRSAQPPYYNKVYKGGGSAAYRKPCLRRGLDTSHARRLAIWHRVSSQGAPGQSGTLYPAGQSSSRGAAGGAEPLTAAAVSLFGLSPDSQ